MTAFSLIGALLIAGAVLFIVLPLVRRSARALTSRDAVNVAVYRDQLRELESDLRSGTLAADQYEKARHEIEARLTQDVGKDGAATLRPRSARAAAIALGIAVPICAAAVYFTVGNPRALAPEAAAEGTAHGLSKEQFEALVARLAARLKDNPEDAEGWVMLGRSYVVLGRFEEGAEAYANATARVSPDAQLLADYADALAMAQGRRLGGEPEKLIARALSIDPNNVKALMLAGSAAFVKRDYAAAAGHWERILTLIPEDSDTAQTIRSSIAEAQQLGGIRSSAGKKAQPRAAGPGRVAGVVRLAPELAGKVSPTDTVFIFARAAEGPRIPLAVLRKQARDLPVTFVLDDSMAMAPQMKLSAFTRVVVGARVSKSANASPQPGDLQGLSGAVPNSTAGLTILIDSEIR